jgi:hypothetical protein
LRDGIDMPLYAKGSKKVLPSIAPHESTSPLIGPEQSPRQQQVSSGLGAERLATPKQVSSSSGFGQSARAQAGPSVAGSEEGARLDPSSAGFGRPEEAELEELEIDEQTSTSSRPEPLPWHIKLLGVAFLIYVVLRLVQMAGWLIRWLSGQ